MKASFSADVVVRMVVSYNMQVERFRAIYRYMVVATMAASSKQVAARKKKKIIVPVCTR